MSVIFAGLDIEGKFVEIFTEGKDKTLLVLAGSRKDGVRLQELFREFKKGRVVQIADNLTFKNSGIWKMDNIEFTRNSGIYRTRINLTRKSA
jgi:hypothetical protein